MGTGVLLIDPLGDSEDEEDDGAPYDPRSPTPDAFKVLCVAAG